MVSNKILVVLLVIAVSVTAFAMAAYVNLGGLGTALSGFGGPIGTAIANAARTPFQWALSGGGPTLAAGYAIIFTIIIVVAWANWHYEPWYKIQPPNTTTPGFQQSTTQTIPVQGLQNTTTQNPFMDPETKNKE